MSEFPAAELSAKAREFHFWRGVGTAFAGIFVLSGWIFGVTWQLIVFLALSVRYGFWRGRGLSPEQIAARLAPREELPPPRNEHIA